MGILQTGNTFDNLNFKQGHSRKVWRETRRQWPAGGKIANVADWVAKGKIPAGTPCAYAINKDTGEKTIKCYTDEQIKAASAKTQATATAIRDGDIYEYMFDDDVAEILKANTKCPLVVFVL